MEIFFLSECVSSVLIRPLYEFCLAFSFDFSASKPNNNLLVFFVSIIVFLFFKFFSFWFATFKFFELNEFLLLI